jgi:putative ABC transport system permease protein
MINLAQKDVSHSLGKFLVTAMGVGLLLGIVLVMIGIYRGMIVEAQILIDDTKADLWIVQEDTLGPFAEASRIHEDIKDTIRVIDGIKDAEAMTFQNIQLPSKPKPTRVVAVGFDPHGTFNPINPLRIVEGRGLKRTHYEIVIADNVGFGLGDTIHLGRDDYKVVGITHGSVSSSGDPLVFISLKDAQELQFLYTNNRIRNDRARGVKNNDAHMVNAIVARIKDGYDVNSVAQEIRRFKYKSVFTDFEQKKVLITNLIEKASKQIGMFAAILIVVSTIIIALIIYTMTLEKMKEIAILKLIGIPNSMIIKMVVQETLLLGMLAFSFGTIFAYSTYDKFPKKVVLELPDTIMLFVVVIIASILASFIGVKKVINADPREAIGG